MTDSKLLLLFLIAMVVIFLLSWWLIKNFASMKRGEKEIYENEAYKKLDNICPFDKNYCAILGKSIIKEYVTKVCQNCPRYINSFDDELAEKALDEIELREKLKGVMK